MTNLIKITKQITELEMIDKKENKELAENISEQIKMQWA